MIEKAMIKKSQNPDPLSLSYLNLIDLTIKDNLAYDVISLTCYLIWTSEF